MKHLIPNGFRLLTLLIVALATGCQTSPKVFSEHDPRVNFSNYSRFAILPLPDTVPGADPGLMLRLRQPALASIREALAGKGYLEVEADDADFAVHLRGEINPRVKVTHWGYRGYAVNAWGQVSPYRQIEVDQYNEGALILEIYDAGSRELVWVGWLKGHTSTGAVNIEKFQAKVKTILQTFPPDINAEQ